MSNAIAYLQGSTFSSQESEQRTFMDGDYLINAKKSMQQLDKLPLYVNNTMVWQKLFVYAQFCILIGI